MGSPNIIPAQYDPRSPSYTLLYTTTKLITLYHDQTKFFTSSKMMLGYPSYSAERRQRCTTTTIRSRRAHSRRVLDTAALNAYGPNDVGSKSHCELTWNRVVAVFTFFGLLMTALVSLCCWSHFQFTVERRRLGAQKENTFTKKPLGLTIVDVDNKVIVTKVKNPACLREGIVPGSQLLSVGDLRWDVTDPLAFTYTSVIQYVKKAQLPIKMSFKCPTGDLARLSAYYAGTSDPQVPLKRFLFTLKSGIITEDMRDSNIVEKAHCLMYLITEPSKIQGFIHLKEYTELSEVAELLGVNTKVLEVCEVRGCTEDILKGTVDVK